MTVHTKMGTEIRDDDGNVIATALRDIMTGEPVSPSQFGWPGERPRVGEVMHPALARHASMPALAKRI